MKVVVTGATGLIGRHLVRRLAGRGDAIVALSRTTQPVAGARSVIWDPESGRIPAEALDQADAIVNLAGRPLAEGRWTDAQRREILESRLAATRACVSGVGPEGPRILISGSAIGYYGPGTEPVDENDGPGDDFLASVCREWEAAALEASEGTRVVLLRTGIVLARDGGALPRMLTPFRVGLGGPLGGGDQWQSWIHIADEVGIITHCLDASVRGPVNAVSPNPVQQREMARRIGYRLRRPSLLKTPAFALRLALGGQAQVALTGQRVVPAVALKSGYRFRFPTLPSALSDLI